MHCELALIGFGEAGSTFASAAGWGERARGWDLLPARRAAMVEAGVIAAESAEAALKQAKERQALVLAGPRDDLLAKLLGKVEPLPVDIHERQFAAVRAGDVEHVGEQPLARRGRPAPRPTGPRSR